MKPNIEKAMTISEMFKVIEEHNKTNEDKYFVLYEDISKDGLDTNSWKECGDYLDFLAYCDGSEWGDPDASYVDEIIKKFRSIKVLPDKTYEFNFVSGKKKETMKVVFRILPEYEGNYEDNTSLVKILAKDGYPMES